MSSITGMNRLRLVNNLIRPYSTKTLPTSASILSSRPITTTSSSIPTTEAPLKPQPFIPKPLSRKHQISTLIASPLPSVSSTTITLTGPTEHSLTLPNLFLRDTSHHFNHLHPSSQQKLFKTSDLPLESKVIGYGVHEINGEDCLVMEWNKSIKSMIKLGNSSEKLSVHPISFLLNLAKFNSPCEVIIPTPTTWSQSTLIPKLLTVPYSSYTSSLTTLHKTLTSLLSDGIVFLSEVGTEKKEGHETELKNVVERIGSIRRTWYGDLWDVKAEEGSKNIAYTNLDLGLHMDLTHFESPPRYQFLHSLLNKNISGGLSYFVDSYHIASIIKSTHPEIYKTLCEEEILFEYKNGGKHTRFIRPTIELNSTDGTILAINYSPPFQGPLLLPTTNTENRLMAIHKALTLFSNLCDQEENQFTIQLNEGDCVIFDNRRILHARTAFEFKLTKSGAGKSEEGGRWLKGAYMDGDEVRSQWRYLEGERLKGKLH